MSSKVSLVFQVGVYLLDVLVQKEEYWTYFLCLDLYSDGVIPTNLLKVA